MHFAFLLYKYFPYGGMQRDFMRFAEECHERGHTIRVYAISWQGEVPDWLELRPVAVKSLSNHRRNQKFSTWVMQDLANDPVDGVVGFNKMAGLDVYYAADSCYLYKAEHERGAWYRYSARYRHFSRAEQAVFGAASNTAILLISETEKQKFVHYHQTPESRMYMLPPGIDPARRISGSREDARSAVAAELGLDAEDRILLFVGSGFIKKGLDRAIRGLAELAPCGEGKAHLLIVGQDRARSFRRLANQLGVAAQCHFLGGRDDIPRLLAAADLLLHPALDEAAGIVLLEALVAGLPVLVTDVCGYAHHISASGGGVVLPSPFQAEVLRDSLREMLETEQLRRYSESALAYAGREDLYSMHKTGAALIEQAILARGGERD